MNNEAQRLEPVIIRGDSYTRTLRQHTAAAGSSFEVHVWTGGGPPYLHVHYSDDEAWHVLEGTLTFRFADEEVEAPAGTTVFVPAGVPHTYFEAHGIAKYLMILTPRLRKLISQLHETPFEQHQEIMRQYESEILD